MNDFAGEGFVVMRAAPPHILARSQDVLHRFRERVFIINANGKDTRLAPLLLRSLVRHLNFVDHDLARRRSGRKKRDDNVHRTHTLLDLPGLIHING